MMVSEMENPGASNAGASHNQLGGWLHCSLTPSDRQAQIVASRFCLSPWMAKDVAWLCFGEGGND